MQSVSFCVTNPYHVWNNSSTFEEIFVKKKRYAIKDHPKHTINFLQTVIKTLHVHSFVRLILDGTFAN
jgi:hypothetical protein